MSKITWAATILDHAGPVLAQVLEEVESRLQALEGDSNKSPWQLEIESRLRELEEHFGFMNREPAKSPEPDDLVEVDLRAEVREEADRG